MEQSAEVKSLRQVIKNLEKRVSFLETSIDEIIGDMGQTPPPQKKLDEVHEGYGEYIWPEGKSYWASSSDLGERVKPVAGLGDVEDNWRQNNEAGEQSWFPFRRKKQFPPMSSWRKWRISRLRASVQRAVGAH